VTPIRALFFVDIPHHFAGAQRSLLAALERIGEAGVEPLVVFPGEGVAVEAFRQAGLRTEVLPAPPALLTFGRRFVGIGWGARASLFARQILPYARALARLARGSGIDVLHYNSPRAMVEAGIAAKLARRPAVMHVRGSPGFGGSYWLAAQTLADRMVPVAHAIVRDDVTPIFRRRCTVVHNGVDVPALPDRAQARRRLAERLGEPALVGGGPLFVSLSSFVPFKGLHHLLTAAAQVRDRGIAARYVLAGGGDDDPYRRWLLERRRELGLEDRVTVAGFVPDPLSILAAADALVLPSVDHEVIALEDGRRMEGRSSEGLPRSILEAMSIGVPAIATRIAGVEEEIEDGETGLLVPQQDPAALAAAIVRVAADDSWRAAAGERARQVVGTRFTVEAAARGLAEVLRGVARA